MSKKRMLRKYFSESFSITTGEALEKEFRTLLDFSVGSVGELIAFWEAVSELEKIIEDKETELYIAMTCFAGNPENGVAFNRFIAEIDTKRQSYTFQLKKRFCESLFFKELPPEYDHLKKIVSQEIALFREENIALSVREEELAVKYREIVSGMTATFQGEEKTVQQLATFSENSDRSVREEAWRLVYGCYEKKRVMLDDLFDELKKIRVSIAKNAGFSNYRDYEHANKGRFSYTPEDLLVLHEAVEKVIVPLVSEFDEERKEKLGLQSLRPWDFKVNVEEALPKPFVTYEELLEKGVRTIASVDEALGAELLHMKNNGRIDAENRKGKAPGGYCSPLYEAGSSFIFMHAVGMRNDVETLVHEAGHAMNNYMSRDQKIFQYLNSPSEVAELASMSMELLSIDHWDEFYEKKFLKRIVRDELKEKIQFLPWGVTVDAFQHWMYLNPEKTAKERGDYFSGLIDRFKIGGDWTELEKQKAMRWMMQLHIFEHPFYYIEYVMAQLGALAMYRNYRQDPEKTIEQYKKFLSVGYAKPVSEVYETAGIKFDFSVEYVRELAEFVRTLLFQKTKE